MKIFEDDELNNVYLEGRNLLRELEERFDNPELEERMQSEVEKLKKEIKEL